MSGHRAEDPDGRLRVGYFTQDLAQVQGVHHEWVWQWHIRNLIHV
jgi:hypothetical protein